MDRTMSSHSVQTRVHDTYERCVHGWVVAISSCCYFVFVAISYKHYIYIAYGTPSLRAVLSLRVTFIGSHTQCSAGGRQPWFVGGLGFRKRRQCSAVLHDYRQLLINILPYPTTLPCPTLLPYLTLSPVAYKYPTLLPYPTLPYYPTLLPYPATLPYPIARCL